ncbi:MAG: UDP-N-acetylmuramate--L-alanine ligase [Verrucomicrobiae bacterium]|nr:UDP-N-acetylmuramate--L-alanine ligase [Verrucomicrobiae bacterium]
MSAIVQCLHHRMPDRFWHFVGVGGSGMSGLARLLLEKGYQVSGSDLVESRLIQQLEEKGLIFFQGHQSDFVDQAQAVVVSSAIDESNVELESARARKIPIFHRAELLSALLAEKKSIVVAGMHGKTTTTSLLAWLFHETQSSFYVGGVVTQLGASAKIGEGEWFIAEGDESDGTLVKYAPHFSLVLNIEKEHLDFYPSLQAIESVFRELGERTKGKIFYCGDDEGATRVFKSFENAISFGLSHSVHVQGKNVVFDKSGSRFDVWVKGKLWLEGVHLSLPGSHNIRNALGAIAVAREAGLSEKMIVERLASFQGARRRFEIKWECDDFLVIDDYGHHPTEIRATLEAAKQVAGGRRLVVVFQPHRFSRTKALKEDFAKAFDWADRLFLTEIYPADESAKDWPDVTGENLFRVVEATGRGAISFQGQGLALAQELIHEVKPGDCVVVLGAGDIGKVTQVLVEHLKFYRELMEAAGDNGRVVRNESLRRHTTLRVGGPAEFWCEPDGEESLARVLQLCEKNAMPVTFIGRGSNLLIKDGGIRGVCLHLHENFFSKIEVAKDKVSAQAGTKLKSIVAAAKREGLGGFEFMEGIPGSLGGALFMNAGAMGGWMFERVVSVRCMNKNGEIAELLREGIQANYRCVPTLQNKIVLSAVLQGKKEAKEVVEERLREFSKKRWESQPAASSAGCIFKNPSLSPAGKLVDELGLKGLSIGGARVSQEHGNFIVNDGTATASDVLGLIELVRQRVRAERGVELETEIIILGDN